MTKSSYRGFSTRYLKRFLPHRRKGRDTSGIEREGLLKAPSRLDVVQAFRLILGREPEEAAIEAHMGVPNLAELRRLLLTSDEFDGKYRGLHPDVSSHPNLNRDRRTVVFIHLLKTGGTSLREIIGQQFPRERRCPIVEDKLHVLSVAELSRYDFFAGHFDISCKLLIPRDHIQTVALFREPHHRLVSLYRFLRAHPATDEFAQDQLIPLAHNLSAEDFFERPELREHPTINNHYLFAFGRSFSWFSQNSASLTAGILREIVHDAKVQIGALTSLGITERFTDSVNLICQALEFTHPETIEAMHVTDNFAARDARFRRVEPVSMSTRLAGAMQDLIQYDLELYAFAVREFEQRIRTLRSVKV